MTVVRSTSGTATSSASTSVSSQGRERRMGYAHYVLADGREAGYGVEATCDEDGCTEKIDRGMGYLCGDEPGEDEFGCGKYFCGRHLYGGPRASRGGPCKRWLYEW